MSSMGARLTAARAALEAIHEVCSAPEQSAVRRLAALGLTSSAESPAEAARREAAAARMRTKRERSTQRAANVRANVRSTQGGVGGDLSSDLSGSDLSKTTNASLSENARGSEQPENVRANVREHVAESDFGALVDCWLEGMRSATGSAAWIRQAQAVGAVRVLQATLSALVPADGDRLQWARSKAQAYVAANPGRTLSVFGFQSWMSANPGDVPTKPREDPETIALRITARAQAEQADREQAGRARVANGRPQTEPTRLFEMNGGKAT